MGFRSSALELANLNPNFKFLPLNNQKKPVLAWKSEHAEGFSIEQLRVREVPSHWGFIRS